MNRPIHTNLHINPSPEVALALNQAVKLNNRALALSIQGDLNEAERLHLLALKLKIRSLGEDHVTTALSWNALGELYIKMERPQDAEEHLLKAVVIRNKDSDAFDAAVLRENLAQVHEMKGNLLEAKRLRRSTGKFACGYFYCPGQVYNRIQLKQCAKCTSIYYCSSTCQPQTGKDTKSTVVNPKQKKK